MNEQTIYALGFFDGVHRGHAALLSACKELARENAFCAGVITFGAHPDTLVLGSTPGFINTSEDREHILTDHFHMDKVVTLPFDEAMRTMSWKNFLKMLEESYGAEGFVCGEDFRFGYKGQGDAQSLHNYCREQGLPCRVVPEQLLDGIRISSTYIRSLLEQGDMDTAAKYLGHPHLLTGRVVHGHQLGRTLGIPTANLLLQRDLVVPRFGVYACRARVEGNHYLAVTNIGTRPTVAGQGITVEAWILDYDGDLYDRKIALEFYHFLRPEKTFPSLEAMQQEIHRNAVQTREYFSDGKETCFTDENIV